MPKAFVLAGLFIASAGDQAWSQGTEIHSILIAPPIPTDPSDSAFVLQFAERLRRQAPAWNRTIVSYDDMCDMLKASDYSCRKLLRNDEPRQLAAAFSADAFLTGSFRGGSPRRLTITITGRSRSGFGGSFSMTFTDDHDANSMAAAVVQRLDAIWLAAALTRQCYDARDSGAYDDALSLAEGARSFVPNHAGASLCQATVYELNDAPLPQLIETYSHAFTNDRSLDHALERLVELYLELGDTLSSTILMKEQLLRSPYNNNLRRRVAAYWIVAGQPDFAFESLEHRPETRSEDLELLRMIAQTCLERREWLCQLDALAQQFGLDSSLRYVPTFYYTIVGVAQNLDDDRAIVQWSGEALANVSLFQEDSTRAGTEDTNHTKAFRMAHANGLLALGEADSAVNVFLTVSDNHPEDPRPLLAAATAILDSTNLRIDSLIPLDTLTLQRGDSLLSLAGQRYTDAAVRRSIAATYLTPGASLVGQRKPPLLASYWLERAITFDPSGEIAATAHALNSLAISYVVQELDTEVRATEQCPAVARLDSAVTRAKSEANQSGNALPQLVQRILPALDEYAALVPQYRAVFKC